MEKVNYEIWWTSLPIKEKERIARKGLTKASTDGTIDESLAFYPGCTRWWNSLPEDRKAFIYGHCSVKHGDILNEWDDANPYGD